MEANITYLRDFLNGVFGIEGQAGSRSADASGKGYSAAVEEHPDKSIIYIYGTCSENFNEVLDLVFPN